MKHTNEQRHIIINWFNSMNNCRAWYDTETNVNAMEKMFDMADGDIQKIRKFIKENAKKFGSFTDCADAFVDFAIEDRAREAKEAEAKAEAEAAARKAEDDARNNNFGLDFLGKIVVETLAKTKAEEINKAVIDSAMTEIKDFIAREYGHITRKVDIQIGERKVAMEGIVHKKFDTILKFVQADEPVFLTGPAGAGKNFLCQQVAKALGLNFYFSNAVNQEHKITGFTDAMGTYHATQFYKAFTEGGLFMLDEMDASIPEVLVILNAAIANRYFDFPAPIGYVAAHPNFRVIAAGNTFGNGADYDYVGRNQLDAASLDRFAMVRVDYDENIENGCANGNEELVTFCRMFRKVADECGIRTIVSYRAIGRMAKLDASMEASELLETCLLKSLQKDDLKIMVDKMQVLEGNKYFKALMRVANRRN